ncbi:MAG: hypothetical protein SCH98_05050, partial [Deferrisomatales bacterium]|nr:hypothetical protein [Deferrisomatales bacterium]
MDDLTADQRLDALAEEVRRLSERVARLEAVSQPLPPATEAAGAGPLPGAEEVAGGTAYSWGSASSVLARTASVCFILVVALVLRTLADAGVLGPRVGTVLGLVYATALGGWGWVLYPRRGTAGSLVAVCGSLLACAVVVEAGTRLGA